MSSTSTTWTTDTNTKSGTVKIYDSSVSTLRITAGQSTNAILELFADAGDTNSDKWRMWVNDADDDLHFANYTSGSWADLLTIQDGGYVGIGTDAPTGKLHVVTAVGEHGVTIDTTAGNIASSAALIVKANDSSDASLEVYQQGTGDIVRIFDTSTEVFTILDGGKVGIGIAAPTKELHIVGTTLIDCGDDEGDYGLHIKKGATSSSFMIKLENEDASGTTAPWMELNHMDNGDFHIGKAYNDAYFTIQDTGYVGIGTTTPGNDLHVSTAGGSGECWVKIDANTGSDAGILLAEEGTNQWALKHEAGDGDLYVWDFQDGSRAVHIIDTGNTWVNDSDSRIKKDITNIDSVLDGINSLRPVTYKKKYGKSDTVHPGLIAQEVLPHFPLVVTGANRTFKEIPADDDLPLRFSGAMGIGYSDFIPYLIKAIQELSAKVTALENA